MKIKSKEEVSRMYRYVIVKCISKGEYVIVSLVTYFNYGSRYVPYAFAISFFFSNILDFAGQKYWVFKNKKEVSWRMLRDIFLYTFVRAVNFFCALWMYSILIENLHMSMIAAGMSVAVFFIPVGFLLYRWLFFGTISDILKSFK